MQAKNIKILEAVEEDIESILDIQAIVWPLLYANEKEGISKKHITESMEPKSENMAKVWKRVIRTHRDQGGESNTWVVKDNDKVVGFGYAVKTSDVGQIRSMYILPEYQNRGIGSMLIKRILAWLGNKKDIVLEVARHAEGAIKFYEQFDFKKTGKTSTQKLKDEKEIIEYEMRRDAPN